MSKFDKAALDRKLAGMRKRMSDGPPPKEYNNLKPCPFCGGKGHMHHTSPGFSITCEDCFTTGPYCDTDEQSVTLWNKRTTRI